jgi:hypothetical protein
MSDHGVKERDDLASALTNRCLQHGAEYIRYRGSKPFCAKCDDGADRLAEHEELDDEEILRAAIAKHRDTSLRYGISRSIDRELWEVLDDK